MCPRWATEDEALDKTVQWYRRARFACEPFMFAEARFRTPWVDDEFAATIRTARQWLSDHPCPDGSLGRHFVEMLGAYAEMTSATVARVMEIRVSIEEHAKAFEWWTTESLKIVHSTTGASGAHVQRERRATVRLSVEGHAS